MHRLSTLIFQYYRSLLFHNVMFSLMVGTAAYAIVGKISAGLFLLVKLLGFSAATGHYYYMYRKSYYYYHNAGLSVHRLYLYSFGLDIGMSAIIFTLLLLWYRSV
ncbi:hypothetical protein GCM10028827_29400 [Mucilaginibacter myungsuensis]